MRQPTRYRRAPDRTRSNRAGMTLVEVMVVTGVLLLASTLFLELLLATVDVRRVNHQRNLAANAAWVVLESMRVLRSADGSRELPLDEFYKDYMVNDLQQGEFVESIRVPLPEAGTDVKSYKISKRFDQDISAVCGAYRLRVDDGHVATVRIAYGGMAATIKRARRCESAMTGKPWNEQTVEAAMRALAEDFKPIDDMRSTADYRLRVAQNLLRRLFLESTGGLDDTVYRYGRTG